MNMNRLLQAIIIILICVSSWADDDTPCNAYYDYKQYDCEIKNNKEIMTVGTKVTIVNQAGKENGRIVIPIDKFAKLKYFKGEITDKNGEVLYNIEKSDFEKTCGFGDVYEIYSDVCYYHYSREINPDYYPYSIEYEYQTETNSLFFWRGKNFQNDIPVKRAVYNLKAPEDFRFNSKIYGTRITETFEEGSYSWTAENLPSQKEYYYKPDGYPEIDRISLLAKEFSLGKYEFSGDSWKDIGQWYFELAQDCYDPDDEKALDVSMAGGTIDNIRNIYNGIIDEYRYVSVSIGVGGWKPEPAEQTRERKYGDCKALSTLLLSQMPKSIEAYPVLALTRTEGKIDTTFPDFGFNHVFVMAVVEGDTVWMDPTCDQCTFGELPYTDQDIAVLLVQDDSSRIIYTPSSSASDNGIVRNINIYVNKESIPEFNVMVLYSGSYALRIRNSLMHYDKDETNALLYGLFPGGDKNYEISKYDIDNLNDIYEPLSISFMAKAKRPLRKIKEVSYIKADILEDLEDFEDIHKLNLDERTIPINLGYPSLLIDTINITWAPEFRIDSIVLPSSDSAMFSLGCMSAKYNSEEGGITLVLSKENKAYTLPVDEFDEFKAFHEKSKGISSNYIKLYGL